MIYIQLAAMTAAAVLLLAFCLLVPAAVFAGAPTHASVPEAQLAVAAETGDGTGADGDADADGGTGAGAAEVEADNGAGGGAGAGAEGGAGAETGGGTGAGAETGGGTGAGAGADEETFSNSRSALAVITNTENWALVNLACVVANGVIMLALMLSPILGGHSFSNVRNMRKIRFLELRVMTVATTVLSLMMFLITQNMSLPMVFFDGISLIYVLIFLVTAGIAVGVRVLGKTRESTPEDPRYIA